MIDSVEYDDSNNKMKVDFTSGKSYIYFDVSKSVYEDFIAAKSKGLFFVRNIKGKYSGKPG